MATREQVIASIRARTEKVVQRLTLDVTANMQESPPLGTPVDTGFARTNWVPNISQPYRATAGRREEGGIDSGPQQAGIARVAALYRLVQGPVFVSNNVGYIGALNRGSSPQSPAGFIQAAIVRAVKSPGSNQKVR